MKTVTLTRLIVLSSLFLVSTQSLYAQCSSCWMTISTSTSANISVPRNKTLCITSTGSVTGSVSMSGSATICNEGSFTPSSFSSGWGDQINNSGTMVLPSAFHVTNTLTNSGDLTVKGNLTSNNGKNIINSGTLDIEGYMANSGSLTNSGEINVTSYYTNNKTLNNSGTMNVTGDFTNSSSGGVDAENSGDVYVGGNFVNSGPWDNTFTSSLTVTGYLKNNSASSATLTNAGDIYVGSYFDNINDFTNTGTIEVLGYFTNANSGGASVTNSGSMEVHGNFANNQNFANTGEVEIGGNFTQTNTGSAQLENDSSFTVNGDLISNNDIYNEGLLIVGGTYENQNSSGVYHSEPSSMLVVDSFVNKSTITSTSSTYGQIQVLSYAENSGSVGTYVDICILGNNGNWDSNTGTVDANVVNCTETVATTRVSLNLRFYLEACYSSASHKMLTNLRSNAVLPKNQPFSENPWGWNGTESVRDSVADITTTVVDWVMVEFRTSTTSGSAFWKKCFFITNDGFLRDGMGNAATIERPTQDSFYVVVTARNHLGVMSSSKVKIQGGAINYNFTTAQSKAYTTGANPMMEVETGVFALVSGDANGDGTINSLDAWQWFNSSGSSGYIKADLNLDNSVDSSDKSLWAARNGMSIQYSK